ncbi:hypothetical protein M8J77_017365 [Diaphorina citri]|nr:hypothetical protein M8J77_017365 [Diaphorina citri]
MGENEKGDKEGLMEQAKEVNERGARKGGNRGEEGNERKDEGAGEINAEEDEEKEKEEEEEEEEEEKNYCVWRERILLRSLVLQACRFLANVNCSKQ